jgi:5-methylcytosine-specific restriction protein A
LTSRDRRLSLSKSEDQTGHVRGPNGFRLCRWCGNEVRPPKKTFCSASCVHEWKLRSSVSYLRSQTYARDLGKCASCAADTRYQKIQIEDSLHKAKGNHKDPEHLALLKSLGLTVTESQRSLWQADHINPVVQGGGLCGLENIRTLCVKCHKGVTKVLLAKPRSGGRSEKISGLRGLPGIPGIPGKDRA